MRQYPGVWNQKALARAPCGGRLFRKIYLLPGRVSSVVKPRNPTGVVVTYCLDGEPRLHVAYGRRNTPQLWWWEPLARIDYPAKTDFPPNMVGQLLGERTDG